MNLPRISPVWHGVLFAVLAAIGFSAKAVLVKLAYRHGVDSVTLLTLRMSLALPFFVLMAWWAQRRPALLPLCWRDGGWVLVLGLLGYYLSSLLDFAGLQYISAGLERLILFLYPTLTVLLESVLQRRRIAAPVWAALLLSYVGMLLVFWAHSTVADHADWQWGALLVFASMVTYSLYLVGAGRAIARMGSLRFTAYASIVASLATLLHFQWGGTGNLLALPTAVYPLAAIMALFSTGLPVWLLSLAIQRIGAGQTALIGALGPVSTLFLAGWLLQEKMTPAQWLGSMLILAGVWLIGRRGATTAR